MVTNQGTLKKKEKKRIFHLHFSVRGTVTVRSRTWRPRLHCGKHGEHFRTHQYSKTCRGEELGRVTHPLEVNCRSLSVNTTAFLGTDIFITAEKVISANENPEASSRRWSKNRTLLRSKLQSEVVCLKDPLQQGHFLVARTFINSTGCHLEPVLPFCYYLGKN